MINHRRGAVDVIISRNPGTVSHIQILQIGKMHFIKQSYLLKYFPAVNGRARTGGKDAARLVITGGRTSHAPLVCPAKEAVHVTGIIHPFLMIQLYHLAADGKNPGGALYGLNHFPHIVAVRLRIIVQKNDVGGGSRADPTVHGS